MTATLKQYRTYFMNRLVRFIAIIKTPYWYRWFDDQLNFKSQAVQNNPPELRYQDDKWKVFTFGGFEYYWPAEYHDFELYSLYKEVFYSSKINPHAYETPNHHICEGDWVIDAGASEGFFVRYALLKSANVLAIEPIPRLAEALQITYKKEIHEGKVKILNFGLGKAPGESQLQLNDQQICSSIISNGVGVRVVITSLDEILSKKIVPTVNFIKMDIEGGEIDALQGAKQILEKYHPKLSIAVYHSYHNGLICQRIIESVHQKYRIKFRGLFIRKSFGAPRPYMLHAS